MAGPSARSTQNGSRSGSPAYCASSPASSGPHPSPSMFAPVATSVSAKGAFPESHPLAVGWGYGPQATKAAEEVFADVDLVLAVGVRYSEAQAPPPAAEDYVKAIVSAAHANGLDPAGRLLIEPGRIKLSGGPKESGHRPAIDPLFRSAARAYGERVLGVILSGTLDDGSVGLRMIRRHGGSAIVQDPREALFRQMPENAIATASPQHVAPVTELADLIRTHARRPTEGGENREAMAEDVSLNGGPQPIGAADVPGTPTGIACPECHGVMWTAQDDESPEYHCRVGHAYAAEALLAAHSQSVEAALWAGVRALQEQASLTKHMAIRAERRGDRLSAQRLHRRGQAADAHAGRIEGILLKPTPEVSSEAG